MKRKELSNTQLWILVIWFVVMLAYNVQSTDETVYMTTSCSTHYKNIRDDNSIRVTWQGAFPFGSGGSRICRVKIYVPDLRTVCGGTEAFYMSTTTTELKYYLDNDVYAYKTYSKYSAPTKFCRSNLDAVTIEIKGNSWTSSAHTFGSNVVVKVWLEHESRVDVMSLVSYGAAGLIFFAFCVAAIFMFLRYKSKRTRNTAALQQGGDRVSVAVTTNSAAYTGTPLQGGAYPTPPPPQTHAPQYSLAYRYPAGTATTPQQPPPYRATSSKGGAYPTPPPPPASAAMTPQQHPAYPPPPPGAQYPPPPVFPPNSA